MLLVAAWFGRPEYDSPVADGGALFQIRAPMADTGRVDLVMHDLELVARLWSESEYDDFIDELGKGRSRRSALGRDAFGSSAPRVVMPRSQRKGDGEKKGLFDSDTLSPFGDQDLDSDAPSWGWLADEVNATAPDAFERPASRSREQDRRLFSGDADGDSRFRSSNGSDDSFYFHRQDRRF